MQNDILTITGNASYKLSMAITLTCIVISMIAFYLIEYGRRKQILIYLQQKDTEQHPSKPKLLPGFILQVIAAFIIIMGTVYAVIGLQTIVTAKTHGMYQSNMSWNDMLQSIEYSPREDKLPSDIDELTNDIILYYKFGCEDCEAIYQELQDTFSNVENLYWVSTRSEQGQSLLKTYPTPQVPAGVYVTDNGTAVIKQMYKKTDSEITLNNINVNTLLDLYYAAHPDEQN